MTIEIYERYYLNDRSEGAVDMDHIKLQGAQAAYEVMNNAGTQNWYFGVDDSDGNKLKIGRGYSAAQGIIPAITIIPGSGQIQLGDPSENTAAMLALISNDSYGQDDCMMWFRRHGVGTSEALIIHQHINPTATPQPIIAGMAGRGTLLVPVALQSGDILFCLDARGYDGSTNDYGQGSLGWTDSEATIFFKTAQAWTGAHHGTQIEIYTTPNNGISPRRAVLIGNDASILIATLAGAFQDGFQVIPSGTSGLGQVLIPDSSSNGCGLSFTLDPDTGFIRAATNAIGFVTAGSERARIDATGSLAIGGAANAAVTAILDIVSTTKGVGFPNMTSTQRDAIVSPRRGLVIYNITTDHLNVWNNSAWTQL